jgi:hypothetical protein
MPLHVPRPLIRPSSHPGLGPPAPGSAIWDTEAGAFWERVHPRCLFVNVYDRSEDVVHALNAAIMQAWQRMGSPSFVQVAPVHAAFHGHEAPRPWCGTIPPDAEETWLQYPTDPDSNATSVGGDCFHPNRVGAERYGEALTALAPPDLALPLRLQVNDGSLAPGESLTLTLTVMPEATPSVVDLYVALQSSDQSVWFLQVDGSLTPEPQPLLSTWPAVPFRAELFRYTFMGLDHLAATAGWPPSPSLGRGRSSGLLHKPLSLSIPKRYGRWRRSWLGNACLESPGSGTMMRGALCRPEGGDGDTRRPRPGGGTGNP